MGLFDGGGQSSADIGSSFTNPSFDAGSIFGDNYNFTPDYDWGSSADIWNKGFQSDYFDSPSEEFMWGANNPTDWSGGGGYQPQWGKWAKAADIASKHLSGQGAGKHKPAYPVVGKAGGTQVSPMGGKHVSMQEIHPTATIMPSQGGGSRGPGALDYVKTGLQVASLFAGCDIRIKTDIEPLKESEVNDALADIAFFVKEIRECS